MAYTAECISLGLWSSLPFYTNTDIKRSLSKKKKKRAGKRWHHFTPFFRQNQKAIQMYIILGFYTFNSLPGGWFPWCPQTLWTIWMREQQLLPFSGCLWCVRYGACHLLNLSFITQMRIYFMGEAQEDYTDWQRRCNMAERGENSGFHKPRCIWYQL